MTSEHRSGRMLPSRPPCLAPQFDCYKAEVCIVPSSFLQPLKMTKPQVLICGTIVHAHEELKNDLGSVAEILVGRC